MVDILRGLPTALQERIALLTSRVRRQRFSYVQALEQPLIPTVLAPQYENRRTPDQEVVLQSLFDRMSAIGSGEDEAVARLFDEDTRQGVMSAAKAIVHVLGWHQEWGDTPNYVSMVLQHQSKYSTIGAFFVNLLVHPYEIGTTYHGEYDEAESRTLLPLRDYPGFGIEVAKYNQNKQWGYYDPNYAYEYTLKGFTEKPNESF